jgi:NADH-quinone oxidoreductase subunit C
MQRTATGHGKKPRYAAVLHLMSIPHNWRLRVRSFCPDDSFPAAAVGD